LFDKKPEQLGGLLDRNFDLRRSICQLPNEHILMVETARSCGCSAKFAGSGGAIVGTYPDNETFIRLQTELKKIGCNTVKPIIQ
jgi:glucuronokinase